MNAPLPEMAQADQTAGDTQQHIASPEYAPVRILRGALAAIIADPDCCAASKAIARDALAGQNLHPKAEQSGVLAQADHIERLTSALEPFANEAENYDFGDGSGPDLDDSPDASSLNEISDITVGDLRRAREAYQTRGAA